MKIFAWLAVLLLLPFSTLAFQQSPSDNSAQASPVFREPFTLKLRVDNKNYYEEHFEKAPYVAENTVYLFAGDNFGIDVALHGDEISGISYQKNPNKADVSFEFRQEKGPNGPMMMMMILKSRLKRPLFLDALMTVPGKKGIYKTSILPVGAGLSNFESWPHPIVQLQLKNFRFTQKTGSK